MSRKISASVFAFVIGIIASFFTESTLRLFIQRLYPLLTDNGIQFVGKNFYLFAGSFYYASFGLFATVLYLSLLQKTLRQKVLSVLLTTGVFSLSLTGISWLDSHAKIVECTRCVDGIRRLRYNEINYEAIIVTSLLLASLPSIIRLLRKRRKPTTGNVG